MDFQLKGINTHRQTRSLPTWQAMLHIIFITENLEGANSPAAQWSGLHSLTAKGQGSIPGQGIKIPRHSQTQNKQNPQLDALERGNDGTMIDFILGGLQSHCRWWLQPLNEKTLALWKKNYDKPRQHIKKQRHHFADKVCIVKSMVFPVVMYGC